MPVNMVRRKTVMMLGLLIVTALMASSLYVNAAGIYVRQRENTDKAQWEEELEPLQIEDIDIAPYIEQYEEQKDDLPEDAKPQNRCIWVVWMRGRSWEDDPTTDAAESHIPMMMRFTARPVMDTGDGLLFVVPRGVVGHDGERYEIEGYGWLRKDDGVFYLKLDGDADIRAVGKVYPRFDADTARRCRFHRVVMKGKITVEGEDYVFALRGQAFRICLSWFKPKPVPEETLRPTTTT
jgi:hypothetical protein